jgi:hypothetical protein
VSSCNVFVASNRLLMSVRVTDLRSSAPVHPGHAEVPRVLLLRQPAPSLPLCADGAPVEYSYRVERHAAVFVEKSAGECFLRSWPRRNHKSSSTASLCGVSLRTQKQNTSVEECAPPLIW